MEKAGCMYAKFIYLCRYFNFCQLCQYQCCLLWKKLGAFRQHWQDEAAPPPQFTLKFGKFTILTELYGPAVEFQFSY